MDPSRFIFVIDAEPHFTVLIRIVATFNRFRVPLKELTSYAGKDDDGLRITLCVDVPKEMALTLSKRLVREIDIRTVNFFEQVNERTCKTETLKNSSALLKA